MKEGKVKDIAGMEIDKTKTMKMFEQMNKFKKGGDGVGIYLKDGSSVTVRASGTEPKNKAYINIAADNIDAANQKIEKLKTFVNSFAV